ncbi:MAG: hypothetical protein ABR497_03335 [Kiritimatiellia bacterium]|nr:hypothetical protein [Lentisphaerota bacterium]
MISSRFILAAALICAVTSTLSAGAENPAPPPGAPTIFQPVNVDPALVRRSMQSRSEYDRLTREINTRKAHLYEENERIKALQQQMIELQDKIDALLEEDKVLQELNEQYKEVSPDMPVGARAFPGGPPPAKQP